MDLLIGNYSRELRFQNADDQIFYQAKNLYFFKLKIPQTASIISPIRPTRKIEEGIPSKRILTILPNARPAINNTFDIVAAIQNFDLIIPINQNAAIAIYKPIIALKMFDNSILRNLK